MMEVPNDMGIVKFFVPGECTPQGGIRTFVVNGKPRSTHSNKTELEYWRSEVAHYAKAAMDARVGGWVYDRKAAYFLEMVFVRELPKSAPKRRVLKCTTRPDLDHYIRAICDGLTHVAFPDDGQVDELKAKKRYTLRDDPLDRPGAHITVAYVI